MSAFKQPGSETNSFDRNVSQAGAQARAAATQTAAPAGTYRVDPAVEFAASPAMAGVNTVGMDNHDPTKHFSDSGMQARAAAAGQAPQGTAQASPAAYNAFNPSTSYPPSSYDAQLSDGGSPASTINHGPRDPQASYQPQSLSQSAMPPPPSSSESVNSLNTARELFQPTSTNQPGAPAASSQEPQGSSAPARQPKDFFNPPSSYTAYNARPDSIESAAQPASSQVSSAGSMARAAATQTTAPSGTGSSAASPYQSIGELARPGFAGQQIPAGFHGSSVPYSEPKSTLGTSVTPMTSQSYTTPAGFHGSSVPYSESKSNSGNFAAPMAPQSYATPAGFHGSTASSSGVQNSFDGSAKQTTFQEYRTPAGFHGSTASGMSSLGGAAARAAAAGQAPAGTGPDAPVSYSSKVAEARAAPGTVNYASSAPGSGKVEVSKQFSSAGMAARAAASGEAPAGTAAAYPKKLAYEAEMSYEAPSSHVKTPTETNVSSPGMLARASAYGMHPPGTGPGSVKGRSMSTLAGPTRRTAPAAARLAGGATMKRKAVGTAGMAIAGTVLLLTS